MVDVDDLWMCVGQNVNDLWMCGGQNVDVLWMSGRQNVADVDVWWTKCG